MTEPNATQVPLSILEAADAWTAHRHPKDAHDIALIDGGRK